MLLCAAVPGLARADGFVETFADDPVAAGRWFVLSGEDGSRFAYDAADEALTAHYDTGLPTARLVRPLGRTLTHEDTFCCRVRFTMNSEGFFAHDFFNAQIALGFLNLSTTGPDRAGFGTGAKAFDLVSFDYFPNITFFGGPTLGTTIINSDAGQGYFAAINFEFGSETELNNPGEQDLPRDVLLTADIRYHAATARATLRVLDGETPLIINAGGGLDGDPTTITTRLTGPGFAVDAFGILLWEDTSAGGATTVKADVDFHDIEVCAPSFGDFDGDCDVDEDDVAMFKACMSGPMIPLSPGCEPFDANGDGFVDLSDFAVLQRNLTGPK